MRRGAGVIARPVPAVAGAFTISTKDGPPGRKTEFWREVNDRFFPLTLAGLKPDFDAALDVRAIGDVIAVDVNCDQVDARRTARDISRGPMAAYYVFEQLSADGSAFHTAASPDGWLGSGDLVLGDADTPFTSLTRTRFGHRAWLFPRALVDRAAARPEAIGHGVRLPGSAPAAQLLKAYLHSWRANCAAMSVAEASVCAEVAGRLYALAAGAGTADEPFREAAAQGELTLVKSLLERRLMDPLLSPRRAAAACGISVRKLHSLFAQTGDSFMAHVTRRRLEAARQRLEDRRFAALSIADLAFSLGFNSLSTFYRGYREAFGEAPGDTRMRMHAAGNGLR